MEIFERRSTLHSNKHIFTCSGNISKFLLRLVLSWRKLRIKKRHCNDTWCWGRCQCCNLEQLSIRYFLFPEKILNQFQPLMCLLRLGLRFIYDARIAFFVFPNYSWTYNRFLCPWFYEECYEESTVQNPWTDNRQKYKRPGYRNPFDIFYLFRDWFHGFVHYSCGKRTIRTV